MRTLYLLVLSILISIHSIAQDWEEYPGDSLYNLEEPFDAIVIPDDSTNLWVLGTPGKNKLDTAFTPQLAMITDSVLDYPINNHSWFDLIITDEFNTPGFFFPDHFFIEFQHKMYSDTLLDGGYIELSFDGGQTFTNIIEQPAGDIYWAISPWTGADWMETNLGLYTETDTLHNGEPGFSGCYDWTQTNFGFSVGLPLFPSDIAVSQIDSLILRFNFISDSIDTQKEGWMIDNFRFYAIDFGGFVSFPTYPNITVGPIPAQQQLTVNFPAPPGQLRYEVYDLQGKVVKKINQSETQTSVIAIDDLPNGLYILGIWGDGINLGSARFIKD